MMNKLEYLFPLTFLLLLTCGDEPLPSGPVLQEPLSAHLFITGDIFTYIQDNHFLDRYSLIDGVNYADFLQSTKWQVPFRVSVSNEIDEVIDGNKLIQVELYLEESNHLWADTLIFNDLTHTDQLLIHPGHEYAIYTSDSLTWRQTKNGGESIYDMDHYTNIRLSEYRDSTKTPCGLMGYYQFCLESSTEFDTVPRFDFPIQVLAHAQVKVFEEYEPILSDTLQIAITYYYPDRKFKVNFCDEGWLYDPCNP